MSGSEHARAATEPATVAQTAPARRLEIRRTTLPNGIVVLGQENHTHPSVVVRLNLRAAPLHDDPDRAGLAMLTASGLTRGTRTRSFEEINDAVDGAGMSLNSGAGRHTSSVSLRCLSEDFRMGIDLLADVTRNPTFPEREVQQLRGQMLTGLKQADDDTGAVADRHFRELIYPTGHPYRLRNHGYQETVARLEPNDLASFHRAAFGPTGAFCIVVGDVAFEEAVEQLSEVLGDWEGAGLPAVHIGRPPPPAPVQRDVPLAGKTQSDLVLGLPGIVRADPDYYALRMANLILGRLGMMGRLGETVREAQGLAYGVHSELDAGLGPGPWAIRAGVNPSNVDAALAAIGVELERIRDGGVTADELLRGQNYTTGSLVLHLESNDGVAGVIQEIELFGLGLDYIDRYPSIVNSLTLDTVNATAARHFPRLADTVRVIAGPERP
jgi:zinc protease